MCQGAFSGPGPVTDIGVEHAGLSVIAWADPAAWHRLPGSRSIAFMLILLSAPQSRQKQNWAA